MLYCLCVLCHLVREGVGLPRRQLLIVEGVAEYTAHHGDVLEEERQTTQFRTSVKERSYN